MIQRWSSQSHRATIQSWLRQNRVSGRPYRTALDAARDAASRACQQASAACQEVLTVRTASSRVSQGAFEALTEGVIRDCAMLCGATADLITHHSPLVMRLLASCARACRSAAVQCAGWPDDPSRHCLVLCEACASACDQVRSRL